MPCIQICLVPRCSATSLPFSLALLHEPSSLVPRHGASVDVPSDRSPEMYAVTAICTILHGQGPARTSQAAKEHAAAFASLNLG